MIPIVDEYFLWVRGIPASAGTEIAEVTPGITSKGMHALERCSASSPPRPKINGSPPLSLTIVFPAAAFLIINLFISSCGIMELPPCFPTNIHSVSGRAKARILALAR